jgi:hypothetical protein
VDPDNTDIGFSIIDSSGSEIFPMDFFEGHSEGDIEIGEPQQDLELVWSNGHSWLTSKSIQYDIEIQQPALGAVAPSPAVLPAPEKKKKSEVKKVTKVQKAQVVKPETPRTVNRKKQDWRQLGKLAPSALAVSVRV